MKYIQNINDVYNAKYCLNGKFINKYYENQETILNDLLVSKMTLYLHLKGKMTIIDKMGLKVYKLFNNVEKVVK